MSKIFLAQFSKYLYTTCFFFGKICYFLPAKRFFHPLCMNLGENQKIVYTFYSVFSLVYDCCYFIWVCTTEKIRVIMVFMKVTRNLEISSREFFETVFLNLAQEIRTTDKTEVSIGDFRTGYHYVHNPENPALRVSFEIVEYQEEKLYKAVRVSNNATTTICYEVTPIDTGITVDFTYESSADANKKKGFFHGFTEIIMLSRMTDTLYNFQKDAITRRDGYVERRTSNPLRPIKRENTEQ